MWQESPASEIKNQRTETKLKLRKKKLCEILKSKRTISNPIKGYNLSLCNKKHYYHKQYKFKKKDAGTVAPKTTKNLTAQSSKKNSSGNC